MSLSVFLWNNPSHCRTIFFMTLRFCNLSVVVLNCSLKLSRPLKTTPNSLGFDLSRLGTLLISSLGSKDNSIVQVAKMVDDDLSAESCKFPLVSQLSSSPRHGVIWPLSSSTFEFKAIRVISSP